MSAALAAEFYARPAAEVARHLLGRVLVSTVGDERTAGRIVETEAYTGPEDEASHAAASVGRTRRNDPLFGPPGTAYIHLNYGVHWCLNAVTGRQDHPAGVLIRALEPLEGLEVMRSRREGREELTNGPARLTQALGVGPDLQRHLLSRPPLWIEEGEPVPDRDIERTTRIGITRAADLELRFLQRSSRWVSRR